MKTLKEALFSRKNIIKPVSRKDLDTFTIKGLVYNIEGFVYINDTNDYISAVYCDGLSGCALDSSKSLDWHLLDFNIKRKSDIESMIWDLYVDFDGTFYCIVDDFNIQIFDAMAWYNMKSKSTYNIKEIFDDIKQFVAIEEIEVKE